MLQVLKLKFMLKRGKTIKTIKVSTNRRGLTQVKAIFFSYKNLKISLHCIMTTKKSTLKQVVSGCAVHSEHHIDMLSAKPVGEEHLHN